MELFYKFSPVLMQNVPDATVDAWVARRGALDARKLIPALVQYDHLKYAAQVRVHFPCYPQATDSS